MQICKNQSCLLCGGGEQGGERFLNQKETTVFYHDSLPAGGLDGDLPKPTTKKNVLSVIMASKLVLALFISCTTIQFSES